MIAKLAVIGAGVVFVGGCSLFPWQSSRYGGETSEVYFLDLGKDEPREVTYTLRLADNVADVFFAFVNYGGNTTTLPTVTPLSADPMAGVASAASGTAVSASGTSARRPAETPPASTQTVRLPQPPRRIEPTAITDFNNSPPEFELGGAARSAGPADPAASRVVPRAGETVGTADWFWQFSVDFEPGSEVETEAILRKVVSDELGNTLNVWVEVDQWSDATDPDSTDRVNMYKIDALADAFLLAGADDDIRDWVTAVLGEPWGDHGYANLLSQADYGNTIDILLLNILRDTQTDSGVVGYFFGKDNYYQTTSTHPRTDYSNERIMFYLDAPMYGKLRGEPWDATNAWPELVISTLAHEFQHMINFYQKKVLRSGGIETETWLNEMASLMIEDLVSHQMKVPGPRGVSPLDYPAGTPGAAGNTTGWLPYFNANNDIGVYTWDRADPAPNYAVNYGLGAFLVRNFGGAQFARELVQSPDVDEGAIQTAFDALGYRVTYREALSQWAAAVLTSDEEIVPWEDGQLDAVYNAGGWFESMVGSTTYRLGSINLFNYEIVDGASMLTGPRVYASEPIGSDGSRPPASVVYYEAGSGLSGNLEWQIVLGANTDLVVVAKAAQ